MNPSVIRRHFCVCRPVAALAFIICKLLSHRLPGSGPIIFTFIVSDINVTPRLIKMIENIAQNPSGCTGFGKTVPAGIIGNDSAVLRGTEIVCPRCRRIRPLNHIFPFRIIKIAKLHT